MICGKLAAQMLLLGSPSHPHSTAVHNTLCLLFLCVPALSPSLSLSLLYLLCHSSSPPLSSIPLSSRPPLHTHTSPFSLSIFYSSRPPAPLFCLTSFIYLSKQRGEIVQCRRREVNTTPAAAPGRCLIILSKNRGSCSSHSLISHSTVAL